MSFGLSIQLIGMVTPYFTKLLIDKVYPANNVSLMHLLVGGLLAVSIAVAFMRAFQSYFNVTINARLSNAISLDFFNHLQHQKIRFFDEHRVGEILSRFQDVTGSLNTVNRILRTVFLNGIYLILVPPFLLLIDWKLALVGLAGIPFNIIITYLAGRAARTYMKETTEAYADLRAFQVDVLSNIRTLKTMALEHYVYQSTYERMEEAKKKQLNAARVVRYYGTWNGLTRAFNTALYTWFGWHLILSGQLSLGGFIAFSAYIGYIYNPIYEFITLFSELQQSSVSFDRMFEYMDNPAEQEPANAKVKPGEIQHTINSGVEMKNVSFSYLPGKPVLKNINLDIKGGTVNAIVGPSGSGKTSLLRLLTRMDEPEAGEISIDGVPINQIPLADLRRQVSVVWQDVGLMQGSIWDNLTIGLESPEPERVYEAIRICCLEEVIANMPFGHDTIIGASGSTLSAGQRQRLSIARALIRDTPILILDEAVANIDVETEVEILNNIFSQLNGKTVIFVTHRLASAVAADQICVLCAGYLIESGTHHELMENRGIYRRMYEAASSPAEPDVEEIASLIG
jgi:ABC-type bacteriocin/lantibiotic exporter with double-glycine peptidase domain